MDRDLSIAKLFTDTIQANILKLRPMEGIQRITAIRWSSRKRSALSCFSPKSLSAENIFRRFETCLKVPVFHAASFASARNAKNNYRT